MHGLPGECLYVFEFRISQLDKVLAIHWPKVVRRAPFYDAYNIQHANRRCSNG